MDKLLLFLTHFSGNICYTKLFNKIDEKFNQIIKQPYKKVRFLVIKVKIKINLTIERIFTKIQQLIDNEKDLRCVLDFFPRNRKKNITSTMIKKIFQEDMSNLSQLWGPRSSERRTRGTWK